MSKIQIPIGISRRKPRTGGLTSVIDKGLGPAATEDLLAAAADWIDVIKLGWTTALFYADDALQRKLSACRAADVAVCTGGTMMEYAIQAGHVELFLDWAASRGIPIVEVANGLLDTTPAEKAQRIAQAADRGFRVWSEVGKKAAQAPRFSVADYLEQVRSDLDAGAERVILEARESGTVGIFTPEGSAREDVVAALTEAFDLDQLVFEAPKKAQQAWFIRRFGAGVSFGNVPPDEVIPLATLRAGLRGDTFGVVGVSAR